MSIWESLNDLSDTDMRTLVSLTTQVLSEAGGLDINADDISPSRAARQIAPVLAAADPSITSSDVQHALEDERSAREIARTLLAHVAAIPELRAEVEARLEEQRRKLSAPELLLVTGALLILAIKLKEIRLDFSIEAVKKKKQLVISFTESSAVLRDAIANVIRLYRSN